jgi:hypothetical protein
MSRGSSDPICSIDVFQPFCTGDIAMSHLKFSKLLVAGLLLGASATQAAAPTSDSEVPAAWYASQIVTPQAARGAAQPVFPTASYEHGPAGDHYVDMQPSRTRPSIAGSTAPFPASPNESGPGS